MKKIIRCHWVFKDSAIIVTNGHTIRWYWLLLSILSCIKTYFYIQFISLVAIYVVEFKEHDIKSTLLHDELKETMS